MNPWNTNARRYEVKSPEKFTQDKTCDLLTGAPISSNT
jgi:hypothetical protein